MYTDKVEVLSYDVLANFLLIHRTCNGGVDSADNDVLHVVMLELFTCLQYLFPANRSNLTAIHLETPIDNGVAAVDY